MLAGARLADADLSGGGGQTPAPLDLDEEPHPGCVPELRENAATHRFRRYPVSAISSSTMIGLLVASARWLLTSEIDVDVLKSEIKKTYASVSEEPDEDFIFPTGRAWADDLGYPEELANVPEAAVESFAGVANPWALGRLDARRAGARPRLAARAPTRSSPRRWSARAGSRDRDRHDAGDAGQGARGRRRDGQRRTSSSSRARPSGCRSRTRASTSSSRTASST